jgi:hypothetical protein
MSFFFIKKCHKHPNAYIAIKWNLNSLVITVLTTLTPLARVVLRNDASPSDGDNKRDHPSQWRQGCQNGYNKWIQVSFDSNICIGMFSQFQLHTCTYQDYLKEAPPPNTRETSERMNFDKLMSRRSYKAVPQCLKWGPALNNFFWASKKLVTGPNGIMVAQTFGDIFFMKKRHQISIY